MEITRRRRRGSGAASPGDEKQHFLFFFSFPFFHSLLFLFLLHFQPPFVHVHATEIALRPAGLAFHGRHALFQASVHCLPWPSTLAVYLGSVSLSLSLNEDPPSSIQFFFWELQVSKRNKEKSVELLLHAHVLCCSVRQVAFILKIFFFQCCWDLSSPSPFLFTTLSLFFLNIVVNETTSSALIC